MNMATQNGTDRFDSLREDLDSLRGDVASVLAAMKKNGGEAAGDIAKAGQEKFDELKSELDKLATQFGKTGRDSVASVEATVRERPLLSVLAAFGVGMIIAHLVDRR
jgi:ElaB/YqjD/DUF883 family membrane-anchored ribosome-binding protein